MNRRMRISSSAGILRKRLRPGRHRRLRPFAEIVYCTVSVVEPEAPPSVAVTVVVPEPAG